MYTKEVMKMESRVTLTLEQKSGTKTVLKDVPISMSVEAFKELVSNHTGIPVADLSVYFKETQLKEGNIANYNINPAIKLRIQQDLVSEASTVKKAKTEKDDRKAEINKKVLLCLTGSVASIKALEICQLVKEFAELQIVVTDRAQSFLDMDALQREAPLFTDKDEWDSWKKKGDPVQHIELRRWADVLLIGTLAWGNSSFVAPLSANTLAKIANGFCDNLLSCVARAWDYKKPFFVAPAMNTMMWENPFTGKHLKALNALGVRVLSPVTKTLACNDTGMGALAPPSTIVEAVKSVLRLATGALVLIPINPLWTSTKASKPPSGAGADDSAGAVPLPDDDDVIIEDAAERGDASPPPLAAAEDEPVKVATKVQ